VLLVGLPAPARASLSFSAPATIDRNARNQLQAVACVAANQCTAVDGGGQQVTFNPASPGTPTPTTIDSNFPDGHRHEQGPPDRNHSDQLHRRAATDACGVDLGAGDA
jgi:hypothetical protein